MKLAALAFPADPALLALIPDPASMQQQKSIAARRRAMSRVEFSNACKRSVKQRLIAGIALVVGINPIGQQREMEIAIRACKIMYLEPFNLLGDGVTRRQHRWNGDQGPQLLRYTGGKIERRQRRRSKGARHEP